MQIQVNDEWRIRTDEHCYRVEQYVGVYTSRRNLNKPKYKAVKYSGTLAGAIRCLTDCMIRASNTTTVLEALAGVQRVSEAVELALANLERQARTLQDRQRGNQNQQRPVIQSIDERVAPG